MTPISTIAHLHWLAVLVAALAGFAVGGLWYGPLFGKAWLAASGVIPGRPNPMRYGAVLLLNIVAATSLAMFIGAGGWQFGLFAGGMSGLTFVATALGVTYLFESRPLKLWLINAGYQTLIFGVMGALLGAWH